MNTDRDQTVRNRSRRLLAFIFTVSMLMPLLGYVAGIEESVYRFAESSATLQENRRLAGPVALPTDLKAWQTFPDAFDRYWGDHFGWRRTLVRANLMLYRGFFPDANNLKAAQGRECWLYLKADRELEYVQHLFPFSEEQVDSLALQFVENARRLRAQGITYVLVFAPNKSTIYPEYLPSEMLPAEGTRLDQLIDHLARRYPGEVPVVDLRGVLLNQKRPGVLLYERTGSHWSELGAYYGYAALMSELERWGVPIGPKPDPDPAFKLAPVGGADLANLLNVTDVRESLPFVVRDENWFAPTTTRTFLDGERGIDVSPDPNQRPFRIQNADPKMRGKALVFRDSFFSRMVPFFPRHFSESVFYRRTFVDHHIVAREKPTVVVHEMVERFLMRGHLQVHRY